ncbi:MAG: hypothetical protein ACI4J0_02735 [Huintestinicola sp.]|uniref:hypothetical protein n=1 Tax=Huintestinicola sp. TaxID=2981661 RepID=UPI003F0DA43F
MNRNVLIKLRVISLIALPFLFLLSAVLTVLFLCGISANEDIPYLCFAAAMLINSVNIITNLYVKKEDMDNALPQRLRGKGFMVFWIVTAAVWLISYVLFVFLK